VPAHIHATRFRFACRLDTSWNITSPGSTSRHESTRCPPCAESPFAPSGCYPSGDGSKGMPRPQHLGAGTISTESQKRPKVNSPTRSVGVYLVTICPHSATEPCFVALPNNVEVSLSEGWSSCSGDDSPPCLRGPQPCLRRPPQAFLFAWKKKRGAARVPPCHLVTSIRAVFLHDFFYLLQGEDLLSALGGRNGKGRLYLLPAMAETFLPFRACSFRCRS
jgi:hypothetical protein